MSFAQSDWHDPGSYSDLLQGDRRCFAWEWLRRSPSYREAWARDASPTPFGLLSLEDPAKGAPAARPVWSCDVDPAVSRGSIIDPTADTVDFLHFGGTLVSLRQDATSHLLLSDGLRSIRIDLDGRNALGAPISIRWHVEGIASADAQLRALAQFLAFARTGRFARSLHRPERRASRWIAALRVHDALATGASTREITAALFNLDTDHARWRTFASPWRLRTQRLIATARACLAMTPAQWLGTDPIT